MLSTEEIAKLFSAVGILEHRAVLMLCYGSGLRIAEAVSLQVSDIDSGRMLVRVRGGKGGCDRYSVFSARMLRILRAVADTRNLECPEFAVAFRDLYFAVRHGFVPACDKVFPHRRKKPRPSRGLDVLEPLAFAAGGHFLATKHCSTCWTFQAKLSYTLM